MRVVVDRQLCESNAICIGIAPAVFVLDAEDRLMLLDENPPESLRADLEEAARRCPRQAIELDPG